MTQRPKDVLDQVRDGEVLLANTDGICAEGAVRVGAYIQAQEEARRVAADPRHRGMALLAAMETGYL